MVDNLQKSLTFATSVMRDFAGKCVLTRMSSRMLRRPGRANGCDLVAATRRLPVVNKVVMEVV